MTNEGVAARHETAVATTRAARTPIGAERFERLLHVVVGVFGLLYSLQASDSYVADLPSFAGPLGDTMQALVLLSVLAGLGGALVRTHARALFCTAFALFAAAVVLWPVALVRAVPADPMPWLVALAPVGLISLIVACRRPTVPLSAGIAVAVWCTGTLSLVGAQSLTDAVTDGAFVVAVTSVLLLLVSGVRRRLAEADAAQQSALAEYERCRLDAACEAERARTDAFVHDSVLMTLLGAAGAHDTAAEALVSRMARHAITVLDDVRSAAGVGARVPFGQVLAAADPELLDLTKRIDFSAERVDDLMLPEHIAEAMVEATLEAIANSLRHAGPDSRPRATFEPVGLEGLRVLVEDDGCGFDPAALPAGRGVRTAVLDRVHEIAGRVLIESAPGRGTRVEISYGAFLDTGNDVRGTVLA